MFGYVTRNKAHDKHDRMSAFPSYCTLHKSSLPTSFLMVCLVNGMFGWGEMIEGGGGGGVWLGARGVWGEDGGGRVFSPGPPFKRKKFSP